MNHRFFKNTGILLMALGIFFLACNDTKPGITGKVDMASLENYLASTWRIIDPAAEIDSITILGVDTITEKQRLKGRADYLFALVQKKTDSLDRSRENSQTAKELIAISKDLGMKTDSSVQLLASYEAATRRFSEEIPLLRAKMNETLKRIPGADSIIPAGYRCRCTYRNRSKEMGMQPPALVLLDKDFKAVDESVLFGKL